MACNVDDWVRTPKQCFDADAHASNVDTKTHYCHGGRGSGLACPKQRCTTQRSSRSSSAGMARVSRLRRAPERQGQLQPREQEGCVGTNRTSDDTLTSMMNNAEINTRIVRVIVLCAERSRAPTCAWCRARFGRVVLEGGVWTPTRDVAISQAPASPAFRTKGILRSNCIRLHCRQYD